MAFKDTLDNPTAATKSNASETQKNLDMAQPIVIFRNDTSAAPFTIRLKGKNYNSWSKMMLLHVSGQGKRGYLTEKVAQGTLKSFFSMVHAQFNTSIQSIHVDIFFGGGEKRRGREFFPLSEFFREHGTIYQHSCVYTLQQNGVVVRKHRHILKTSQALRSNT
ncbi:hypothetical protein L3X38_001686 [Prunus dulcis]|uniref:Retrotransposon Copia-like N-terminal domain-containing protein n=1 Tax=Prunus dulcis TaxID=3755 RepID=A0AAD4WU16_PRUDU|nr:hypothetical protein L3X38_001686 [Prunus dulcis]